MGKRDLGRHDGIVIGQIRHRVLETVLQFDLHSAAELLEVEGRRAPVDADLGAHVPGIVSGEVCALSHPASLREDDLAARRFLVELADGDDLLELGDEVVHPQHEHVDACLAGV
jgi:hypothetical protein